MAEKSLFIKLDKHEEVNKLIADVEQRKESAKQKIELMKEIIEKEKKLLDQFENSLKTMDSHLGEASNLLNSE